MDPDVLVQAETPEGVKEFRGAKNWAKGAVAFAQFVRFMQSALVDGLPGIIVAPKGKLTRAVCLVTANGRIARAEVVASPEHLRSLKVSILGE